MSTPSQLRALSMPFPDRVIKDNPSGGGTYVPHPIYSQRLLLHLGPYDFTLVEIIRGHVDAKAPNPDGQSKKARDGSPALTDAVVGVVMRLTVTIDDRQVSIEDVGDCENPHNWDTDGKRLKDAMSDALKRCSRHLGLGLHLYAKKPDEYFLSARLRDREQPEGGEDQETEAA